MTISFTTITKVSSAVFSMAVLGLFTISTLSSATAFANTTYKANDHFRATVGLNIRDKNCKIVSSVKQNGIVTATSDASISCKVNNVSYNMTPIKSPVGGFVATNFLEKVGNGDMSNTTYTANVAVNLRDASCKKITTIAKGVKVTQVGSTPEIITCKVGATNYNLTKVKTSTGQIGYSALAFYNK